MKKIYFLLFFLFLGFGIQAQILNIPQPLKNYLLHPETYAIQGSYDYPFSNYVIIDSNGNGEIEVSEASLIKSIRVGVDNNLVGLQQFMNLQGLDVSPSLSAFNISDFPQLKFFRYSGSLYPSTSLDLTSITGLEEIQISAQNIVSINFGGLSQLKTIKISTSFHLNTVNFTGLNNLETLYIYQTTLASIDYASMPNLKNLRLSYDHFTAFDISPLIHLETLEINGGIGFFQTLTLPNLPSLTNLRFYSNGVLTLNLGSMPSLETIYCSSNSLTSLTFNGDYSNLTSLECTMNHITSLNLTGFPSLQTVDCESNDLTSLNLSDLPSLELLECKENELTTLNLSNLPSLKRIDCMSNQLTSLSLNQLASLELLSCSYNFLTSLTMNGVPSLSTLNCIRNRLPFLNLSGLSNLKSVYCYNNNIASLNLTGLVSLDEMYCSNNQLSSIDISGLLHLHKLSCGNNPLQQLTTSTEMPNFYELNCSNAQLQTLDIQKMRGVSRLFCSNNSLTSLYVKNNLIQTSLDFSNNPNLQYICGDTGELNLLQSLANSYGLTGCAVVDDCFVLANDDFELSDAIVLYPNPVQEILKIQSDPAVHISGVKVYDILGQQVLSIAEPTSGIDVSGWKSGTYFIRIESDKGVLTQRIVKK